MLTVQEKEARWWRQERDGRLLCYLCPRLCRIGEGQAGFCFIRKNVGGRLVSLGYGRTTGFAVDPIEKKPLNHFLPGTTALSFGTAGCNLGCRFCQNWDISKARMDERTSVEVTPESVVALAKRKGCPSIAFTYNDPTIWAEFAVDVAKVAHRHGLKTIFVTAGYITPEAREEIFPHMDATNVDLKSFTEDFYAKVTLSHLAPVLDTLKWLATQTRVWTEVTNLLIPTLNTGEEETRNLSAWIRDNMGPNVPLHFTAFHPDFKMRDLPPTPPDTLRRARDIAIEEGLNYVYVGNVHDRDGQTTFCPACGAALIHRDWNIVLSNRLQEGRCVECGQRIAGVFSNLGLGPRPETRLPRPA
jgi:pyruvate formate lyase activating enzyme